MRLLLEYEDTDEYTYSCTITVPILHNSPEEALAELKREAEKYIKVWETYCKEVEKYYKEWQVGDFNRCVPDYPSPLIPLGGGTFSLDSFLVEDSGKKYFSTPNIYTLDQYFAHLENIQ